MSIELNNVSYTYLKNSAYESKALDNINLRIEDGEFVGIVGKIGSGKSTLLDIIASFSKPDKGSVKVNGKVGVVFQFIEKQLFESTVYKDVGFGIRNMPKDKQDSLIKEVLEYLGFNYDEVKDKSPFEFSIGEKRKLALAGVLISKPDILILDEVFSGLDFDSKSSLLKILTDLNAKGTTIILISHNNDIICEYTNRVIVLKEGGLYLDGKTSDIFSKYVEELNVGYIPNLISHLNKRGFIIDKNIIKYEELLKAIESRYTHE